MDPIKEFLKLETRRQFFGKCAMGLGGAALASLLPNSIATALEQQAGVRVGGLPELPHFAPKAKRAIYLFMSGAPSQMDLFDYKPKMGEFFDKDLPETIRMGQRLTTMTSGQARFPSHRLSLSSKNTITVVMGHGLVNCYPILRLW